MTTKIPDPTVEIIAEGLTWILEFVTPYSGPAQDSEGKWHTLIGSSSYQRSRRRPPCRCALEDPRALGPGSICSTCRGLQ